MCIAEMSSVEPGKSSVEMFDLLVVDAPLVTRGLLVSRLTTHLALVDAVIRLVGLTWFDYASSGWVGLVIALGGLIQVPRPGDVSSSSYE